MTPKGTSGDDSPLRGPLTLLTRLVVRFPLPTLIASLALALVAGSWTASRLGMRTSRLDLLNPESSYNKLWIDYIGEFGDRDDTVVVVEGDGPQQVVPALDQVAAVLRQHDRDFQAVLHRIDLTPLRDKGLYQLPLEDLRRLDLFIQGLDPVLQGDWSQLRVASLLGGSAADAGGASPQPFLPPAAVAGLATESLRHDPSHPERYVSPWPDLIPDGAFAQLDSQPILLNQGRLGLVLLHIADQGESFARGDKAIAKLRRLIAEASRAHPDVQIGLTGLPVMENDEMQASSQATLEAGAVSLVGVACLFMAGFGGLRHPLMTVAALMVGILWSFGYVTLAVGHLNILSMSFGVILIGLGIDFGIHYLARYLRIRETVESSRDALVETAGTVGPGIVTGGLTTAVAFLSAGFTDFTGVAELGIIAGGGIVLCLVAALVALPAMLQLHDRTVASAGLPRPLNVGRGVNFVMRAPRLVLVLSVAATALCAAGLPSLWYDHNLLNMQPEGLESVELEHKLLEQSDQSLWYALSVADTPEELLRRKQLFLQQTDVVERTEEIVSLLPGELAAKQPIVQRIAQRLSKLPEEPPLIPVDSPEQISAVIDRLSGALPPQQFAALEPLRAAIAGSPPAEVFRRMSILQQRMASDLLAKLRTIRQVADPRPPEMADLPEPLVRRYVGTNGRHLLKIYGKGNIWDTEALRRFVQGVRNVDPKVTGKPLQTYEASRQMRRSYIQASCYSLLAVTVVLVLDFGSLLYVVLALAPVAVGMLQTFGLLGLLDVPLNPANMIVLPLILGIGIDDGVHVVHDFRSQSGRYRISSSTASAVLMTSLTTMVGFGSMMLASHRGLASLGRVLTLGVLCCCITSMFLLPAVLSWLSKNRTEGEPAAPMPIRPRLKGRRLTDPPEVQPDSPTGGPPSAEPPAPHFNLPRRGYEITHTSR
jgi:hypothetical protein